MKTPIRQAQMIVRTLSSVVPDAEKLGNWLMMNGFFLQPASTRYHGAYPGGLFDHSWNVVQVLDEFTEKLGLKWQRMESPFIVGMFHDLCKIDQYVVESETDGVIQYTQGNPLLKGHGDKSVMLLSHLMQLTEEEMMCIRFHMGAFEPDDMSAYGKAIERFPNVLYTHTADMVASRLMEKR